MGILPHPLTHCRARRQEHFLCEEPECAGCLAAFATQEELQQHRRAAHSRAMPRFDRSRARPLQLHSEPMSNVMMLPSRPTSPGRAGAPRCAAVLGHA